MKRGVSMAEYIGKKMSDNEVMHLFPKDYVLMRYESDSVEDSYGEILWIGKEEGEIRKLLDSADNSGHYGIVHGISFYENSLGCMF